MIPRFIRQSPPGGIIPWAFLILLLAIPQTMASGQTWDRNEVLKAEGYQLPPETIAEAVLAPRHLNVTLSNPNADKSWFLILAERHGHEDLHVRPSSRLHSLWRTLRRGAFAPNECLPRRCEDGR